MKSTRISRRTALRGLLGGTAVTVGLPPLEAMLDSNGVRYADGAEIPKRFGLCFWGNGVNQKFWTPTGTGTSWTPSVTLDPLVAAAGKENLSIVTNTYAPTVGYWAHHSSFKTFFAAAFPRYPMPNYEGFPDFGGPRFDEIIRTRLGGKTKFDGIEVQVSRAGSNQPNLRGDPKSPKFNPQAMFDQLFADFMPGGGTATPSTWVFEMKKSVLDAVQADGARMKNKLGAADRVRVDEHMASIRSLENSIDVASRTPPPASCLVPPKPGLRPGDMPGGKEPLREVNTAMCDLLAYALSCDRTRTFALTLTEVQSGAVIWQAQGLDPLWANQSYHSMGHDEPGDQPNVQKVTLFLMEQFAYLLRKLKSVPVGAGTLLDHCCVLGTSEQAAGRGHGTTNPPMVIAGKAGFALKGGVHYQAVPSITSAVRSNPGAANYTRVLVTIMRAVGALGPTDGFGTGPNRADSAISELLV